MNTIEIKINGKTYPCRQTMGAMLRYKKETGKEVSEIKTDVSDMCTYLYCCTASACKHDDVEFDYSLMDFADSLTIEDMAAWADLMNSETDAEPTDADGTKKKK